MTRRGWMDGWITPSNTAQHDITALYSDDVDGG